MRRIWIFGLALAFLIWGVGPALSGTVGKITGKVVDQNGDPLPGANVVLEGTQQGASADANGRYFILSVAPGRYSLMASLVGYQKQTKTDVEVKADYTSTVNFELKETTLELEAMMVVAERPPVEPDNVMSKYVVGTEEIALLPTVRNVSDVVELQPGIDLDGNNTIRGGSAVAGSSTGAPGGVDVNYIVDGIRLPAKGGPGDRAFSKINKTSVQELTVITGGMEAEYGDVQAGVINVVMREGSRDYHGSAEYRTILPGKKHWGVNLYDHPIHRDRMRWSDPAWVNELHPTTGQPFHVRQDYTGIWGHFGEASVSGPLMKDVSFFLSANYIGEPAKFPGPTDRGFTDFPSSLTINMTKQFVFSNFNLQTQWKFGWDATPDIRLKTGGFYTRNKAPFTVSYWGRISEEGQFRGSGLWTPHRIRGNYRDLFMPRDLHNGFQVNKNYMYYLSMTHMLGPKTFYELRLSQYSVVQDSSDVDWAGFTRYPSSERALVWRAPSYDADGWFIARWPRPNYTIGEQTRRTLKFDLSSQVTQGHYIKTGFDITRYSVWWVNNYNSGRSSEVCRYVSALGVDAGDGRANIWGHKPNSVLHPYQSAWYIQDKMEFEGMVVNVGVRYDRWDHNTYHTPIPMAAYGKGPMLGRGAGTGWPGAVFYGLPGTDPLKDVKYVPLVDLGHIDAWSPRLGISHPITANAALHYSFGVFRQTPTFWDMYGWSTRQNSGRDFNGDGDRETNVEERFASNEFGVPFGSPFGTDGKLLPYPTTTSFEVGADWNFVRDYTLRSAVYYKSSRSQITGARTRFYDPAGKGRGYGGITLGANGHADIRGFELGLRKRFSHNFAFQVSFNQMWASSASRNGDIRDITVQYIPDATFIASQYYWWDRQYVDTDGDGVLDDVEPVWPTADEARALGEKADALIRSLQDGTNKAFDPTQSSPPVVVVDESYGKIYLWQMLKKVTRASGNQGGQATIGSDRNSTGSVQFLLSTPPGFGPKSGDLALLGNIRLNLVYRIKAGRAYGYTPPAVVGLELEGGQTITVPTHEMTFAGQEAETRSGPLNTRTDLYFEKEFRPTERMRATLFVNVTNLFDQQDLSQISSAAFSGADYTSMGLDRPKPNDQNYLKYGDDYQTIRYEGAPRKVEIGLGMSF